MVPQGGREGVGAGERASGRVARVHRRAIEEEEMGVGGARPSLYICTLSKPRVLVMRKGAAWPLSLPLTLALPSSPLDLKQEGRRTRSRVLLRPRSKAARGSSQPRMGEGEGGRFNTRQWEGDMATSPQPRVVLPKGPRNQMPFLSPGLPRPNRPALVASFTAPQRPYASTVAAYLRALAIPFGVCPALASMPRLLILLIL